MIPMNPLVLMVISLAARAYDVEPALIAAVGMRESNWNLLAIGDRDAEGKPQSFGPMQLHTQGAGAGYPQNLLQDWTFNIMRGTEYLKACLDMYPNNLKLALAAYRQGMGGAALHGYEPSEAYINDILKYYQEFSAQFGQK